MVDDLVNACHQQGNENRNGKQIKRAGEIFNGVILDAEELEGQVVQEHRNGEKMGSQDILLHCLMNVVYRCHRVCFQRNSVQILVVEDLHAAPPLCENPTVLGTEIHLGQFALRGAGIKLGCVREVGDCEAKLLRLHALVGPHQVAELADHPSFGSHGFQFLLNGFLIIEREITEASFGGSHYDTSSPNTLRKSWACIMILSYSFKSISLPLGVSI